MYRRPKFLELLLEIREQMSRDSDYDVDLFAEMVRSGKISEGRKKYSLNSENESKPRKNSSGKPK